MIAVEFIIFSKMQKYTIWHIHLLIYYKLKLQLKLFRSVDFKKLR